MKAKRSHRFLAGVGLMGILLFGSVSTCLAGSQRYTGTYVKVYVSNTSDSAYAEVGNAQPQHTRYAGAWEQSYNKSGTRISNKTNYSEISSGSRIANEMNLINNYRTIGGGKIYSGKTPSTTLLESRSFEVYV